MIQLHPSYTYEDLVRGMTTAEGELRFVPRDGVLVEIARVAERRGDAPTVLVLDELNRCNLGAVFGEVLSVLDYDKRGRPGDAGSIPVQLQYPAPPDSLDALLLPPNLWVLGTMNTADRSIAMVDFALRRRFRFLDLRPDRNVISTYYREHPVFQEAALGVFDQVKSMVESQNLQVGHSYFLADPWRAGWGPRFVNRMLHEVGPLLDMYHMEGLIHVEDHRGLLTEVMRKYAVLAR